MQGRVDEVTVMGSVVVRSVKVVGSMGEEEAGRKSVEEAVAEEVQYEYEYHSMVCRITLIEKRSSILPLTVQ